MALPVRIAVIGNHVPRQCGIATFTTDLCDAIAVESGAAGVLVVVVNDPQSQYNYPARVRFEIAEDDLSTYQAAADFLNSSNVDLVCLQHEYGIFGGRSGSHILRLLQHLKMPVVTTLHTVLREPDLDQLIIMQEIAARSDRLIVMSEHSSRFLQDVFGVPGEKKESDQFMASLTCPLRSRLFTKLRIRSKERLYYSRSACCLQTRDSRT